MSNSKVAWKIFFNFGLKARIIAGFFVLLILTELIMRGFGLFLMLPTVKKNEILADDSAKLRILALGESTTADYYSKDDGAWPRQLELKLQEAGIQARVYNEGVSGTETPYIVSRLQNLIDTYHPHIVISMLGVNDRPNGLKYEKSATSRIKLFANHLRVVRLFSWLGTRLNPDSCELDQDTIRDSDEAIAFEAVTLAITQPLPAVESFIRESVKDNRRVALILLTVARKLTGKKVSWKDTDPHRPFIDRAFDLYPNNSRIAIYALEFAKDAEPYVHSISNEKFLQVSDTLLKCANTLPSYHLVVIADHALKNGLKLKGHYQNFTFSGEFASLISYHYRLLHKILNENQVLHLAMQYPTLPVNLLKNLFSDESGNLEAEFLDIKFISNEENFKAALAAGSYEKYFIDRFGTTWGHATQEGNALIANSAKEEVLGLVRSTEAFRKFRSSDQKF